MINAHNRNNPDSSWHRRLNRPRRHHRNGLITWGTLLSVLLLMILVSLVSNTAIVVNQKMATQNQADSSAYSGAVWMARGMNFVSATNHVIGELNAMYVMHHAMGGKWLDEHFYDGDRNGGDWKFTFPAPLEYGGLWYQLTKIMMTVEFYMAKFTAPLTPGPSPDQKHYDTVHEDPVADIHSAIWEGKENLMNQMNLAYALHNAGIALVFYGYYQIAKGTPMTFSVFPPTVAAGFALIASGINNVNKGVKMMKAAKAMETAIYVEYEILNGIELAARAIAPAKIAIPEVIFLMHGYQRLSVGVLFPMNAIETSQVFAERNNMNGFVLGDVPSINPDDYSGMGDFFEQGSQFLPTLPITREEITDEEKSQMIRATNPWCRFWRTPIQMAFMAAPTSLASSSYKKWTNRYIYQCSEWLRTDTNKECENEATCINRENDGEDGKGILLYVMKDLNDKGEKGEEDWNKEGVWASTRADAIFCYMGYAHSKRPPLKSPAFFRQENPHGMVSYSQAMIYNANPQPAAGEADGGSKQPKVAWDTLAWDHEQHRVPEWKDHGKFAFMHDIMDMFPDFTAPKVKLNWQAKLTPVTSEKLTKTVTVAAAYDAAMGDGDISQILLNGQEGNYLNKATHVGAQAFLQNH